MFFPLFFCYNIYIHTLKAVFYEKIFWAAALFTAVLFATCDDSDNSIGGSGGGDNGVYIMEEPLPAGVHIAGYIEERKEGRLGCYWSGDRRVVLESVYSYNNIFSISASKGKVLVIGEDRYWCYWVNGRRFEKKYSANNYSGDPLLGAIIGGNVFVVFGSEYYVQTNFYPYYIAVFDGKKYMVGPYKESENNFYLSYFIDDVRYDIKSVPYYDDILGVGYWPTAIAPGKNGSAYIAGSKFDENHVWYGNNWCYYNGNLIDLAGTNDDWITQIMSYDNKVYFSFGDSYWVGGNKVTPDFPDGAKVNDCFIAKDGKIYMAGSYLLDGERQACYWVDGVRHDLPGLYASNIFVE